MATTKTKNLNPLPPVPAKERAALKEDIKVRGLTYPIVESAGPAMKGEIVDGFTRSEIIAELAAEGFPVERKVTFENFNTEAEFRLRQFFLNTERRQLTMEDRLNIAIARLPWERKLAEERQLSGVEVPEEEKGRATERVAADMGISRKTLEHAITVVEEPKVRDLRDRMLAGELTVNKAYKQARERLGLTTEAIMRKTATNRFGEFPPGKFSAIVLAPKWREDHSKFEAGRVNDSEIAAIDIPGMLYKEGIVCLWVTTDWLYYASDIVRDDWKLDIITTFVQITNDATQTDVVRDRTRFGIIATQGKLPPATSKTNTIIQGDGAAVPPALLDLMEELGAKEKRLLAFGKTRKAGWTSFDPEFK